MQQRQLQSAGNLRSTVMALESARKARAGADYIKAAQTILRCFAGPE
jgi:hypothetical protein